MPIFRPQLRPPFSGKNSMFMPNLFSNVAQYTNDTIVLKIASNKIVAITPNKIVAIRRDGQNLLRLIQINQH